jgi:hypothetical protein
MGAFSEYEYHHYQTLETQYQMRMEHLASLGLIFKSLLKGGVSGHGETEGPPTKGPALIGHPQYDNVGITELGLAFVRACKPPAIL